MSFRELRNFCEMMRSLGYQRSISMENFRTPNFELVADILDWLIHRFEPNCGIPDDISTEAHRIEFIKAISIKVLLKTGIKLNLKNLYKADGFAVKEMLKLATLLFDAQRSTANDHSNVDTDQPFVLGSKLSDISAVKPLVSNIVEDGAGLFDLLNKEKDNRLDREKTLRFIESMSVDLSSNSAHDLIEKAVSSHLGNSGQNLEQLKAMTSDLQRDEKTLEMQIKKKKQELDRSKKRLASLVNVRPAFMDEYEHLEQEFERYYEQYVWRFLNLDYLEHEVDKINTEEQEIMEENERRLKKMQKRLRDEEWQLLRGDDSMKEGKERKGKRGWGAKQWMPPGNGEKMDGSSDGEDMVSGGSGSDSEAPISVASQDSDEPAILAAGSDDDDDIEDESEVGEGFSDDDGFPRGKGKLYDDDTDF